MLETFANNALQIGAIKTNPRIINKEQFARMESRLKKNKFQSRN